MGIKKGCFIIRESREEEKFGNVVWPDGFEKELILFVNEEKSFNILLEETDEGMRWWCPTFKLEPIIYK